MLKKATVQVTVLSDRMGIMTQVQRKCAERCTDLLSAGRAVMAWHKPLEIMQIRAPWYICHIVSEKRYRQFQAAFKEYTQSYK